MRPLSKVCLRVMIFAATACLGQAIAQDPPERDNSQVVGVSAPLVAIPEVASAPTVDGRVEPAEWAGAAVTCGFRESRLGYPTRSPTTVSFCYDARNLYCLFECKSPTQDLGKWVGKSSHRDVALDSPVDLLLSSERWPVTRYACFAVSASGAFADQMSSKGASDPSWNPDWEHAAASEGDRWIAEIAIPWGVLDLAEPQPGAVLRANFGRSVLSLGERSAWGGYPELEKGCGRIALAGKGPVAAIRDVFVTLPNASLKRRSQATVEARLIGEAQAASLDLRLAEGEESKQLAHPSVFSRTSHGGRCAAVTVDVPVGSSTLEVSVRDTGDRLLWHHALRLEVPDLLARVRSLVAMLDRVGNQPAADFPVSDAIGLRKSLEELRESAGKRLSADGLVVLTKRVGEVAVRVNDLNMLARAQQALRKQHPRGGLPSYYVSNPPSTRKNQPATEDPGPLARALRIGMARGEYEPVQIVVCAVSKDLKQVQVSATALRGPKDAVIPTDRVAVTPLGFVRRGVPSRDAPLLGVIPDVLFPNRATEVPAGKRQPFLITIQTTAKDEPGEYRGMVQVTAENSAAMQLPLVARVYDVTLPIKSHLRTVFVIYGHSIGPYMEDYRMTFREYVEKRSTYLESLSQNERNAYLETYLRHSKLLLAYRVSPSILRPVGLWSPKKRPDGSWDFSEIDRYLSELAPLGLTTFNVGGPPIYDIYVGRTGEVTAEHTAFVRAVAAHLKERGWWDLHYVYGYDEASRSMLGKLRANYGALVEAVPDLKIMQTAWSPDPALRGLVKIWCPLTQYANVDAIRAGQKAGEEVWWYVCCSPTKPYANVFMDYPGIDQRILGWMTYRYGIQGFLYWGVDWWMWNSPPLSKYARDDYAKWATTHPGGDGSLLYPAAEGDLPLPSLRLALLRDGFEDYDLFKEVEGLAAGNTRLAKRARDLLSLEVLVRSLTDYTQDDNELLARRQAILKVGEELTRSRR